MKRNSILHKTLARALSVKRPHGGSGVTMFEQWLYDRIPAGYDKFFDGCGNLHVDARITHDNKTLFVAHIDTVHKADGANKIRKTNGKWFADGAPLGADDGAGVAMLMHLLHSGINAYFIFTQGEECGGIGAKFVATHYADLLAQFDRAIAFDRRGIDSVITHQGWGRCASDAFGSALADALNNADANLMYLPDDTGVYTDTAEFVDIIPECTNISVGYYAEHSDRESLDIYHFISLSQAVLLVDWDNLPTERDPLVPDPLEATSVSSAYGDWRSAFAWDRDDEEMARDYLIDAIYDAQVGITDDLIDLMCESVYPENPQFAARFVNPKLLTEEMLEEALTHARTYDTDTVLCMLFDAVHCEV